MGRKKNPTSEMNVAEKMNTPLAQCLGALITDVNALKDFLDVSAQAVNQYRLGLARPSLENLCKIADFYGVSTDYLLGRSNIPTSKPDIQAACVTTGLSKEAVENLIESVRQNSGAWTIFEGKTIVPYRVIDTLNLLLESKQFKDLFSDLGSFLIYGNDKFFNQSPVDVTQDEIDKVLDFLEWKGRSSANNQELSELHLQMACDTLKIVFHNVLEKETEGNGKHHKDD